MKPLNTEVIRKVVTARYTWRKIDSAEGGFLYQVFRNGAFVITCDDRNHLRRWLRSAIRLEVEDLKNFMVKFRRLGFEVLDSRICRAQVDDRNRRMQSGLIYQVYPAEDNDQILFEGSKEECFQYARTQKGVKVGQLVWEPIYSGKRKHYEARQN